MSQELREELELLSGWDIPKCDVLEFLLDIIYELKTLATLAERIARK